MFPRGTWRARIRWRSTRPGAAHRAAARIFAGGAQYRTRARSGGPRTRHRHLPWSPLASGFLAGKYSGRGRQQQGSRLEVLKESNNPVFNKFTERNWKVLDAAQEVAKQLDRSAAQVALNWVATQPGMTSTIMERRNSSNWKTILRSSFEIPAELRRETGRASRLEPAHPYMFFEEVLQERVHGGVKVARWS